MFCIAQTRALHLQCPRSYRRDEQQTSENLAKYEQEKKEKRNKTNKNNLLGLKPTGIYY